MMKQLKQYIISFFLLQHNNNFLFNNNQVEPINNKNQKNIYIKNKNEIITTLNTIKPNKNDIIFISTNLFYDISDIVNNTKIKKNNKTTKTYTKYYEEVKEMNNNIVLKYLNEESEKILKNIEDKYKIILLHYGPSVKIIDFNTDKANQRKLPVNNYKDPVFFDNLKRRILYCFFIRLEIIIFLLMEYEKEYSTSKKIIIITNKSLVIPDFFKDKEIIVITIKL